MDYLRQITPQVIGREGVTVEAAVQALLHTSAIRDLVTIYSIARDDKDIESLLACFDEDGTFSISETVIQGQDDLRVFYTGNMDRYRTSLHTTHTHLVHLEDDDYATGIVTGHAELSLGDTLMITGTRYWDTYVRRAGRWLFKGRVLKFMYAVPFEEMGSSFRDTLRLRWPGEAPRPGEYPETSATWNSYKELPAARDRMPLQRIILEVMTSERQDLYCHPRQQRQLRQQLLKVLIICSVPDAEGCRAPSDAPHSPDDSS
jgi:hypothetical protein